MPVPHLVPGVIDSFIHARHRWDRNGAPIRYFGLHVPVFDEVPDGAERIANYFATTSRVASTAYCTDNNSTVRCLHDNEYGASAKGINREGVHVEMTGHANQTKAQWMDAYSVATMKRTANLFALHHLEYGIPVKILNVPELRANQAGIVKHSTAVQAFGGDFRSDPGENFPDEYFINLCNEAIEGATPMAGIDFCDFGDEGPAVSYWQRVLRRIGLYEGPTTGIYDLKTVDAVSKLHEDFNGQAIGNRVAYVLHRGWIQGEIAAAIKEIPSTGTVPPHTHTAVTTIGPN